MFLVITHIQHSKFTSSRLSGFDCCIYIRNNCRITIDFRTVTHTNSFCHKSHSFCLKTSSVSSSTCTSSNSLSSPFSSSMGFCLHTTFGPKVSSLTVRTVYDISQVYSMCKFHIRNLNYELFTNRCELSSKKSFQHTTLRVYSNLKISLLLPKKG